MLSLIASHARVKAPWVHPCGLLDAKEFVVVANRVVTPRGAVVPGAGAGSWGGRLAEGRLAGQLRWPTLLGSVVHSGSCMPCHSRWWPELRPVA